MSRLNVQLLSTACNASLELHVDEMLPMARLFMSLLNAADQRVQ